MHDHLQENVRSPSSMPYHALPAVNVTYAVPDPTKAFVTACRPVDKSKDSDTTTLFHNAHGPDCTGCNRGHALWS